MNCRRVGDRVQLLADLRDGASGRLVVVGDGVGDQDLYLSVIGPDGDPTNNRYYLFVNDGTEAFTEQAVARGVAVSTPGRHFGWGVRVRRLPLRRR